MRPGGDQSSTGQPTRRLLTVHEAADVLGLTVEAVRSRIKRGTLEKEKGEDGTVFVVVDDGAAEQDRPGDDQATALALMQAHLDSMADQLAHLREQLAHEREANRENRRIIAGLVQRVPELEPASEPRESPVTASDDGPDQVSPDGADRRSWWRKLFGT